MKIFLVEDSLEILDRLHALITEVGGLDVVGEADSQEPALAGIFGKQPEAVILDLNLASGSGIPVLQQVKARHPATQVIVLTNHAYPQYREKCRALGADHFLDKSRDFGRLGGLLADLAGAQEHRESV